MARCKFCEGLSIEKLVGLAQEEFLGHEFPHQAFYQHHPSFHDLELAAKNGCDICQLILECFEGAPVKNAYPMSWPWEWLGPECNREASMHFFAKSLPDSTVRMCINSSHVYGDEAIDKVRVFDTILVHLGPKIPIPDSEVLESKSGLEEDLEFPMLVLGLETLRSRPLRIGGFDIGRYQLDPDIGSETNLSIARDWLANCKNNHTACSPAEPPVMPTRIVDVGTEQGFGDVKVLRTQGLRSEYAALSHCWGGPISTLLTTKTLSSYQGKLPFETLPANFRDALTITRNLGLRYVWIDSLCIIQDSKDDWQSESKQMGLIYRDATLTISAMASPGSTAGILKCSSPLISPSPTTLPVYLADSTATTITLKRFNFMEEDLGTLYNNGHLCSRGWTLQESTLSLRNLFYGVNQIYWKCGVGYRGADGLSMGQQFPERTYDSIRSLLTLQTTRNGSHSQPPTAAGLLNDFYSLVEDYTSRQLTFASDKLQALSGLAHLLHPVIGGGYLAGIWSCDIAHGLAWRAVNLQVTHVSEYRAPSWSWAVTDEPVCHNPGDSRSEDVEPYELELLSHNTVLEEESNPFGQVKSGSLSLRGLAVPLYRSDQAIEAYPSRFNLGYIEWDDPIGGSLDSSLHQSWDVFRIIEEGKEDEACLLTLLNRRGKDTNWSINPSYYHAESYLVLLLERSTYDNCLVLRRVDSEEGNVYERVGFVRLERTYSDWMKKCKMQTVTLI